MGTVCDELPMMDKVKSCTASETAELVSVVKLLSPLYWAVIECVPAARLDVAKVATPDDRVTAVPSAVVPSLKVTVPVGVLTEEDTVAVKVMEFLAKTGFTLLMSATLGVALLTVRETLPVADV